MFWKDLNGIRKLTAKVFLKVHIRYEQEMQLLPLSNLKLSKNRYQLKLYFKSLDPRTLYCWKVGIYLFKTIFHTR